MSTESQSESTYISTGVAGLDAILGGGFKKDGFYLLQGNPGSGKTTLALQYLLARSQRKESTLYITLTESRQDLERTCQSHSWNLEDIAVFDLTHSRANLGIERDNTVFYPSEVELGEITQQIIAEVERVRPQHVVFDGLSELRLLSVEPLRYRHQMLAMKHFFEDQMVTVLLLDDRTNPSGDIPPESLVGGNITMERYVPGYGGARRRLEVTKVRGSNFRDGYHDYEIKQGGLVIHPRLVASEHREVSARQEFSSGVDNLDRMTGGGLHSGTTTLLLGPSGTGKSTVAMKYVATALQNGNRAAVYAFDEVLSTLFDRSEKLCLNGVRQYVENGQLHAQQIDPAELSTGGFASEVRRAVEQDGVKIVVIDSINGYLNAMTEERFLPTHLHELFTYLNQQGIVTITVVAQHGLLKMDQAQIDISYLSDTVLLFRHFEAQGHILKALSVFKKRTGPHEQTLRQLSISTEGIDVGEPLEAFHGIMTGVPEYDGRTSLTLKAEEPAS